MTQPPSADKVEYVDSITIRRMFNESQYPKMISDGTLKPEYLRDDHLKEPEKKGEPICTHSQMIRYNNKRGEWVLEVFQYLRNDKKTLGASGKPDPKRLRCGNIVFALEPRA